MEKDRETIGLTPESQSALALIENQDWFAEGQDIARFSLAYAIRKEVAPGSTLGTDTRWSAGNFDKSGDIRALLEILYPESAMPVRLMEHFVNEGLKLISERLQAGSTSPIQFFEES